MSQTIPINGKSILVSAWNNISDAGKYSGTNTADLLITNADIGTFNGKQYRCVVNSSGAICSSSATSNAATLTINAVIKIASHPSGTDACDGSSVDLSVEGYFDALTYTWEYNDGGGFKTAVGDHSMTSNEVGKISTLTIPAVNTGMNSWKFRCLVSDGSSTDEYSNEVSNQSFGRYSCFKQLMQTLHLVSILRFLLL